MLDKEKTYIYALIDPRTQEVRYIGKANNPFDRLKGHLGEKKSNTHKYHWIETLKTELIVPILQILEVCDKVAWQEKEIYWIKFFKSIGSNLTNSTDGGDGYTEMSKEVREKISKLNRLNKGRKFSEERNRKIGEKTRIRFSNPEYRKRMGEIQKRIQQDPEFKKRKSESHKGKHNYSEEVKKKIGEQTRLRSSNPEYKKKMCASQKGKHHLSDEAKRKVGESTRIRFKNPEYRKKRAESIRRYLNSKTYERKQEEKHKNKEFKIQDLNNNVFILKGLDIQVKDFCIKNNIDFELIKKRINKGTRTSGYKINSLAKMEIDNGSNNNSITQ